MSHDPALVKRKTIEAMNRAARPHEWLDTTWPGYPHIEQCMFCAAVRIPETENQDCLKRPQRQLKA